MADAPTVPDPVAPPKPHCIDDDAPVTPRQTWEPPKQRGWYVRGVRKR